MWLGMAFVHQHRVSQNFSLPVGIFSTSSSYIKYWHRSPGTHGENMWTQNNTFSVCECFTQEELSFIAVPCVPHSAATAEPLPAQFSSFIAILHRFFAFWTNQNQLKIEMISCDRCIIHENLFSLCEEFSRSPQEYQLDQFEMCVDDGQKIVNLSLENGIIFMHRASCVQVFSFTAYFKLMLMCWSCVEQ